MNNRYAKYLFRLVFIFLVVSAAQISRAANFYWLATRYDNNWFDGRNWSHTLGGTAIGNSCACAGTDYPGSSDDVIIDASTSGQVNYSSLGIQMRSMTWTGTANATSELYGYGSMTVSGSVVFVSNMKMNASYITLYGSGGSDIFTTAGNDMKDCSVAFVTGTYALTGDYLSTTNYGKISVGGIFSTNNYNISVNNVSASNAAAVTFNMGSSVITCIDFNMNYTPGSQTLTINPGTSTVNFTNYFVGSDKTYNNVIKVGTSGLNDAILGANTFNNLTINPGVTCKLGVGVTQTILNNLTVVGTAANRITLGNYGSGVFTLFGNKGSAMAYVDITNGIAQVPAVGGYQFTTTNSTKTNCHGWDLAATPITFGNASKVYGAASFNMTASSASTGAFTYSIVSGSSFASINASTGAVTILGAGTVTVQATQAPDIDYLTNSTTATLLITKAPLTVTTNPKARVYGAANPSFDFTYSGFVNGETSSVLTTLPTASSTAIVTSPVGAYGIVGSGGSATNYSFTYSNAGSLSITPAPIVVTVNNASRVYGAANPTFTYSYSGFVNGDNASAFQSAFSAPATSATTGSAVGVYAINATGGNVAPNYSTTVPGGSITSGTLTVTKASLSAAVANASRVYGAANPSFTLNYTGFVNGETASVITTPPTVATSAVATSPVGSYVTSPSGGSATNYSFTYTNGSLSITQASLTITANNKNRTYGAANPAFDFAYSGFANGETSSVLNTTPTATCAATPSSSVGSYTIIPGGASATNYSIAYANGTLSVGKALITVTLNNQTRVYGAADPTFTFSYSGFVNGETSSVFTAFPTASPTSNATSSVGSYLINFVNLPAATNYSFNYAPNGFLTITKATLTATAANASRIYGAANPIFTINYSGFVNGETASVVTVQSSASTSAIATSPVASYSIVPSGGSATNYSFTYVNGSLSITKAPLTVSANNASRMFGAADPVFTFTFTGFVNGDNANSLTTLPVAATTAMSTSDPGSYAIIPSAASSGNYSFAYNNGTLTITQAGQTITFDPLISVVTGISPFTLAAIASSGLPVTYSSSNLSVATVSGNVVTIVGTGTTSIKASQVGNNDYLAASNVTQSLFVKYPQIISFAPLAPVLITDASFDLTATSDSGLDVNYTSSDLTVATVSGNTITIMGAGITTITASQDGDATYGAAIPVMQPLIVNKIDQAISFSTIAAHQQGDVPFMIEATSSSGLDVTFTIVSGPASVSANEITLINAGSVVVKASQAGNAIFGAATDVVQSFCVNPSKPSITSSFTDPENPVLTSSALSGNQWLWNGVALDNETNTTLAVNHAGVYSVQVTITGCASPISDGQSIVVTGIEPQEMTILTCSPNPATNTIRINWPASQAIQNVLIVDMNGKIMAQGSAEMVNRNIDVSSYSAGLFLIRLNVGEKIWSSRFVKN